MPLFALCCRLALAGVFAASALGKLRGLRAFADSISELVPVPVPRRAAAPLAVLLVLVEAAVAAGLVVPRTVRPALGMAEFLLGAFVLVILRARRSGSGTTCACFGSDGRRPLGALHLWRDLVLAGAGVVPLLQGSAMVSIGRLALACLPAAVVVALVVRLEDLAALLEAPAQAAAPRGASLLEPRA